MTAALILILSIAILGEFSIAQWRSVWMAVAAQPLSRSLEAAVGLADNSIGANDFDRLVSASRELCPTAREGSLWLKEVSLYYRVMRTVNAACAQTLPTVSAWTKKELVSCSRYAAVVLDQRINGSLSFASEAQTS